MAERLNLAVDDGVGKLMTALAGGERRRGTWLSDLVRVLAEQGSQETVSSLEMTDLKLKGMFSDVKELQQRVSRVEQLIAGQSNGHN